jgi:Ca2+-binding EF-hand superfamily protein
MAPKRTPLKTSAATAASASESSRGGKQSPSQRGHKKGSSTPPKGGGESQRKAPKSTAEQLDEMDEAKKKKLAKKPGPKPLPEVDITDVEDMDVVCGPLRALVADMQKAVDDVEARLAVLDPPTSSDGKGASAASTEVKKLTPAEAQASKAAEVNARQKVVKVWQEYAGEQLAAMASSLQGALLNDSKLRELFDKIDLDRGGTIDRHELHTALAASGKQLTDAQMEAMMKAADEDGSGDIDFQEFSDILKGVKATKAAAVIERNFRKHAQVQKSKATRKGATENAPSSSKAVPQKIDLDKLLGEALMAKMSNPKELVGEWDRKRKGAIDRIEFRLGLRETLDLNPPNKDVDEWFDRIDTDGSGTLDVTELHEALKALQDKARRDAAEKSRLRAQSESLKPQIAELVGLLDSAVSLVEGAHKEVRRLAEHRALPWVDGKVGAKLVAKTKTPDNPKGLSQDDIYAQWNVYRETPEWLNKDEFVAQVRARPPSSAPSLGRSSSESYGAHSYRFGPPTELGTFALPLPRLRCHCRVATAALPLPLPLPSAMAKAPCSSPRTRSSPY